MTTRAWFLALHAGMVAEQRVLLMQAAEGDTMPTANALLRIADLEGAIMAVEAMIEESEP